MIPLKQKAVKFYLYTLIAWTDFFKRAIKEQIKVYGKFNYTNDGQSKILGEKIYNTELEKVFGLHVPLNNVKHHSFLVVATSFYKRNMSLAKYSVVWVPDMFLSNTSQEKKKTLYQRRTKTVRMKEENIAIFYTLFTCQ